MQTKPLCVLIHIWTKGEVGLQWNRFKPSSKILLLTVPRRYFFEDHLCYSCSYVSWSTSDVGAPWKWFKPSSKIFYWLFHGGASFVDHLCYFCLVIVMLSCTFVNGCLVVTCWERADLLALVCMSNCEVVTFPLVSWVWCGAWLYRFLFNSLDIFLCKNQLEARD